MASKFKQGKYIPFKPEKYVGNVNNIVYRSSWEHSFMQWCDLCTSVVRWASEEFHINYIKPTDNKPHRYFPDFYIEVDKGSKVEKILIEIKPIKDTELYKPKRKTGKSEQKIVESAITMAINEAKWEAAKAWCRENGITFMVLTEKELGIGK